MPKKITVTNDYVVTYDNATHVLIALNSGLKMIEAGHTERGLAMIKRAKESLRDYCAMKNRAHEVTESYIDYLKYLSEQQCK